MVSQALVVADPAAGFGRAVLPLVLAHVLLPPLSVISSKWVTWLLSKEARSLLMSFMTALTDRADDPLLSFTRLSHMFVHGTYAHSFNNILGLLLFGLPVYKEFRAIGLFFVFLVGGYVASLPSFLRADQIKEAARSVTSATTVKVEPGNSFFKRLVRNMWNRHVAPILGELTAEVVACKRSCGSSGGGYALMGCSLVLQLQDTSNIVYRSVRASRWRLQFPGERQVVVARASANGRVRGWRASVQRWGRICKSTVVRLLRLAATTDAGEWWPLIGMCSVFIQASQTWSLFSSCYDECRTIYPTDRRILESKTASTEDQLKKVVTLTSIGHAAHVQGFTFGAAFALVVGSFLSARRPPL